VTYQGSQSPRSARMYERDPRHPPGAGLPGAGLPSAALPSVGPPTAGPPTPPPRRGGTGRSRRVRGSPWFWSAIGLAVAGVAVIAFALTHKAGGGTVKPQPGALVTTFLPGELKRVPNACTAVTAALLDQYLPGRSKAVAAQPLEGTAASQCSWTVDQAQRYRFMEVAIEAYGPSGLASGNGSATNAAQDALTQARVAKLFPPPKSHEPKATVTAVPGLGQDAFSAAQRYQRGGVLDMVTLVVRYHNVVVTVIFEARAGHSVPDPPTFLPADARAVAGAVLARLG
jgi:hypothetical protein